MPRLAPRMDHIVGSATVGISNLVAERRRAGADIISLSLGEPDFDTPPHVREAAKRALDAGHTHYTPGPGIPELREAVAEHHRRYGVPSAAANVLVTPTKHAVLMAMMAVAGRGDDVLVPDPGWVSYAPMAYWAEAAPVPVPLEPGGGITADAVGEAITRRTRAIVLNSPSNPTGAVDTHEDVRGIVDLAQDHDLWIISDEIYKQLRYSGEHLSPAALDFERTIIVDGLSKSFAMTGWRIGWAVAPELVLREMNKLQSHSVTHCTSFAQHGAVAALTGPQDSVESMRAAFLQRRDVMVEGLRGIGVDCPTPHGAFYCFPSFGGDDDELCRRLIDGGVATTPGSAFGERGRGHLRFSFAADADTIREAVRRVAAVL